MSEWSGPERRHVRDRRHLDWQHPRIQFSTALVSLIVMIVLQTGGAIWSLSTLFNQVDDSRKSIEEMRREMYTKSDAARDRELTTQVVENVRLKQSEFERRITGLETTQTQILSEIRNGRR